VLPVTPRGIGTTTAIGSRFGLATYDFVRGAQCAVAAGD
jgi:hypothetical protein